MEPADDSTAVPLLDDLNVKDVFAEFCLILYITRRDSCRLISERP
jgi:hypothetical protein